MGLQVTMLLDHLKQFLSLPIRTISKLFVNAINNVLQKFVILGVEGLKGGEKKERMYILYLIFSINLSIIFNIFLLRSFNLRFLLKRGINWQSKPYCEINKFLNND